ncbi:MAG TPA: toxin TcdB middle/N-terminal domain-containing protein, partial [Kofleriaceae bacterium]|nr:toxin TcdB middle/N-terminal domain-containing protein [Kofleriaceae bacterium]
PQLDALAAASVVDLLGNGTACLVWSTTLPGAAGTTEIHYLDLMASRKPHILVRIDNHLGTRTDLSYAASTQFYLADRCAGRPWPTRLPFPVHVLECSETSDGVSGTRFVQHYAYHDGYYDGAEREFRGFAEVEQLDTAAFDALGPAANVDAASHVPPTLTRTRFHVGAERGSAVLPAGLDGDELREAVRSLKGAMLRQEVLALDGTARELLPYLVTEQIQEIRLVQRRGPNRHAVFASHVRESTAAHSERNPTDARVLHSATLEVDAFGNVLLAATVAYGRPQPNTALSPSAQAKQAEIHIAFAQTAVTNAIDAADAYRTPATCEAKRFILTGLAALAARYRFDELADAWRDAAVVEYEVAPTPGVVQKRLVEHARTLYRRDDLTAPLPLGQIESRATELEVYQLAFTPGLVAATYGNKVSDALLAGAGHYVHFAGDAQWWIRSGRLAYALADEDEFAAARAHFFAVRRYIDPAGSTVQVTYDAYDLMITETMDALGHRVRADADYRVMAPFRVTDMNGNRREACFDALGLVVGTAVMGKASETRGDSLAGFVADLSEAVVQAHLADPLADPHAILGRASTRIVYDAFAFERDATPVVAYTITRETHDADLAPGAQTATQHGFAYSDGSGRVIQSKSQAAHGAWEVSGWVVLNNKGEPVRQFEPFFSASHHYEPDVHAGVSSILFYDPTGRRIGALHPDHSWDKIVFDAWQQETWDVNDTVLLDPKTDPDLGPHFRRLPDAEYLPTWHAQRAGGGLGAAEQSAAAEAATCAATPTVAHLDAQARPFLTVANTGSALLQTRVELDAEGNQRAVVDVLDRTVVRYDYDMLGHRTHEASMEAGERWTLNDALGKPISAWTSLGHQVITAYDALHRPTETRLGAVVVAKTIYGEDAATNQIGQAIQRLDQAGIATTEDYDFKGNRLSETRQIAQDYKGLRDWAVAVAVQARTFTRTAQFDALNRAVVSTDYDGSVVRPRYNPANQIEHLEVNVRGAATATVFLTGIEYNARRQRVAADHGNGVRCTYEYDPRTFRLARLRTTRDAGATVLQDLQYTYTPAGTLTHIADAAQQTIYFANQVVTATAEYHYDATYRLLSAEGREHIGQVTLPGTTWDDAFRVRLAHPQDGQAMRRYTEQYQYDGAGNLLQLAHQAAGGNWTRTFAYTEASQLEPSKCSNRLSSTTVSGATEAYSYDVHGNALAMPHLSGLSCNKS